MISRALIAALAFSAPAYAGDVHGAVKQVAVHYDDLNISTKSGAHILIARIETASKTACGGAPDIRDLKMRAFFSDCMKSTMDHAVASIPSPMVAAVYNGTAGDEAVQVSQR
ncbi:MAG TPA: UrcA family protein [Rhizomicrobium sp.]|nr:UrcA family protein [Rhizomicrobium sp.]